MKPRVKLAETRLPSGGVLALYEQDGSYAINLSGQELMHSKASASERELGRIGMEGLHSKTDVRALIGGLGLGFTLDAALACAGPDARLDVVELLPEVIAWNREHLGLLHGRLLDDPRVEVRAEDALVTIQSALPNTYDAIMLDVDNGPTAMVAATNVSLYTAAGLRALHKALKPGGRAVIWSAGPDERFERRLRQGGFSVKSVPTKAYESAKRAPYLLFIADRPA